MATATDLPISGLSLGKLHNFSVDPEGDLIIKVTGDRSIPLSRTSDANIRQLNGHLNASLVGRIEGTLNITLNGYFDGSFRGKIISMENGNERLIPQCAPMSGYFNAKFEGYIVGFVKGIVEGFVDAGTVGVFDGDYWGSDGQSIYDMDHQVRTKNKYCLFDSPDDSICIRVSKARVTAVSKYFHKMLDGQFREGKLQFDKKQPAVVILQDLKPLAVLHVLSIIHGKAPWHVSNFEVIDVFLLAEEYLMCIEACKDWFQFYMLQQLKMKYRGEYMHPSTIETLKCKHDILTSITMAYMLKADDAMSTLLTDYMQFTTQSDYKMVMMTIDQNVRRVLGYHREVGFQKLLDDVGKRVDSLKHQTKHEIYNIMEILETGHECFGSGRQKDPKVPGLSWYHYTYDDPWNGDPEVYNVPDCGIGNDCLLMYQEYFQKRGLLSRATSNAQTDTLDASFHSIRKAIWEFENKFSQRPECEWSMAPRPYCETECHVCATKISKVLEELLAELMGRVKAECFGCWRDKNGDPVTREAERRSVYFHPKLGVCTEHSIGEAAIEWNGEIIKRYDRRPEW